MRSRGAIAVGVLALLALLPSGAAALPASGPREDVNQSLSTTRPGAPAGVKFSGVYHAAHNRQATPPYLEKMVFYPPKGMRYDTNVPAKCTASDAELEASGKSACPAASLIGHGPAQGIFSYPFTTGIFDRYTRTLDVLNNTNEQILLVN